MSGKSEEEDEELKEEDEEEASEEEEKAEDKKAERSLLGKGEKADTRRDAAQKFYCRSLRGFHLQIPRAFLFATATRAVVCVSCRRATERRAEERRVGELPASVRMPERTRGVAE